MMRIKYIYSLVFLTVASYAVAQTIDKIDYSKNHFTENIFLKESGISDPYLCNKDSLKNQECEYYDHYLTTKGNIISKFYCPASYTESFKIGVYTRLDSGILIKYHSKYLVKLKSKVIGNDSAGYFMVPQDNIDSTDYNSSKLKKYKTNIRFFKVSDCTNFAYARRLYMHALFERQEPVPPNMPWPCGIVYELNMTRDKLFIDKIRKATILEKQ